MDFLGAVDGSGLREWDVMKGHRAWKVSSRTRARAVRPQPPQWIAMTSPPATPAARYRCEARDGSPPRSMALNGRIQAMGVPFSFPPILRGSCPVEIDGIRYCPAVHNPAMMMFEPNQHRPANEFALSTH